MKGTVTMTPILRNLCLGAAFLAATVLFAGGMSPISAFAQSAAPAASAPLPEAAVRALQEALNRQGIAVATDGVLGEETRAAIRRYQSQHHLPVTGEPDRATLDKLGVAGPRSEGPGQLPAAGPGPGGAGMMGMMTPEMMTMMQGMMAQGGVSPGTMGQGQMPMMGGMAGPGMMGQGPMPMAGGIMPCPMMGMAGGPGMLYGVPQGAQEEMTPERVRALLDQWLTQHGNPRLKIGTIAPAADGSVTAEILTVEGSLVQKLAFNRYPGLARQITE